MTARERLTAPGVGIHFPRCRACARKAGVRSVYGHDPREPRLQASSRPPLQPEPESVQRDSSRLPDLNPHKDHLAPIEIP